MKIGVIGCGALGSYYGGKLQARGESLHCLLRSDRDWVRQHGIHVRSPQGDFHFHPRVAATPEEIGVCDLVLIGLKTTANGAIPDLLPPLVDSHTAILSLQNGLGNIELLESLFPTEQILGGLCFICVNRVRPGEVHHIDHGRIVLGEAGRWPEPRTHDIAMKFRYAGVPCNVTDNLRRAQWEKLVWNIPFNGLGVASSVGYPAFCADTAGTLKPTGPCLTTDQLLEQPEWHKLVKQLMHEVIDVAQALGYSLAHELADRMIEKTKTMGAYRPSTLIDFESQRPLEWDTMFHQPLERARTTNVATPQLERLTSVIKNLIDHEAAKPAQD